MSQVMTRDVGKRGRSGNLRVGGCTVRYSDMITLLYYDNIPDYWLLIINNHDYGLLIINNHEYWLLLINIHDYWL